MVVEEISKHLLINRYNTINLCMPTGVVEYNLKLLVKSQY